MGFFNWFSNKKEEKTNMMGSFISSYIQEIEKRILECMYKYISQFLKIKNNVILCHDGIMIFISDFRDSFISLLEQEIKRVFNFDIKLKVKDMDESINLQKEIETYDQLIDYLNDFEIEFVEDEIKEMWDNRAEYSWQSDLVDWLQERVSDIVEHSYSLVPEYSNCFFTAKAAQEHLDKNHYHYHKNADVYLNHAWRNPEAELVSTFLCGLVGKELYT
jgi:hypothetical protein